MIDFSQQQQQHFVVASNDDDDDNWSQCSISYPLRSLYIIPLFHNNSGKKQHDFMDKILTSFDEGKKRGKDDQATTALLGSLRCAWPV